MRALLLTCCGLALAASVEAQGGGTWETKSPMHYGRGAPAAVAVDGRIYAIAGTGAWDCDCWVSPVEVYDPDTDTWTVKGPMQDLRVGPGVAVNGRIYMVAGYYGGGSYADTVNEYDPTTDTWRRRAPLPIRNVSPGLAVLDGRIHAIGGSTGSVIHRTHYEFDPTTNVWTAKASMRYGRSYPSGAALGGKVYAIGGNDAAGHVQSSGEVYDPATDMWTEIAPTLVPRWQPGVVALNGRVYLFGGWSVAGLALQSAEAYDPVTNTWEMVTPMPDRRAIVYGATVLDGKAYALGGGVDGRVILSSVLAYTPPAAALQFTKPAVTGCLNASGKITLPEPAPAGGLTVTLHSDNSNATVPASVTVKAGATTKSFTIETSAVAATETATIEASLPEGVASAVLTLRPMGVKWVTLTPDPVVGGATVAGLLTLPCPAGPGDIAVTLTSTKAFIAEPTTDTILIPVGTQDMPFEVRTTPVFAPVSLAIKATANEVTKSKKLEMTPGP